MVACWSLRIRLPQRVTPLGQARGLRAWLRFFPSAPGVTGLTSGARLEPLWTHVTKPLLGCQATALESPESVPCPALLTCVGPQVPGVSASLPQTGICQEPARPGLHTLRTERERELRLFVAKETGVGGWVTPVAFHPASGVYALGNLASGRSGWGEVPRGAGGTRPCQGLSPAPACPACLRLFLQPQLFSCPSAPEQGIRASALRPRHAQAHSHHVLACLCLQPAPLA